VCHYEKVTVPVPAVNVKILKPPEVVLDEVNPAPTDKEKLLGNFKITMPEPPLPPFADAL
jgi:hypothetical protein